jgi:hypothetical protein
MSRAGIEDSAEEEDEDDEDDNDSDDEDDCASQGIISLKYVICSYALIGNHEQMKITVWCLSLISLYLLNIVSDDYSSKSARTPAPDINRIADGMQSLKMDAKIHKKSNRHDAIQSNSYYYQTRPTRPCHELDERKRPCSPSNSKGTLIPRSRVHN